MIADWLKKKKFKEVILVGHSFGGKIAAIIGAENPKMIKKLILIASAGIPHTKILTKLIPSSFSQRIPLKIKRFFASRDYQQAGGTFTIIQKYC